MSVKLSFIVATDAGYDVVARTISYALKQTVLDQVEMIVACENRAELNPNMDDLEQFGAYQIVELPGGIASGHFIATAIEAARAPAFMYLEEHNYPPPHTAEVAIRELVENERPALGFAMLPSNPGIVAWAHLYGQFGHAVGPYKSGPARRFGGHHASYRRDHLMRYGDQKGELMNNEAVLHEAMRAEGIPLYLTGEVEVPHAQISDFGVLVRQDYLAQRVYADSRMKHMNWGLARRLIYALGSPLIPFKRAGAAGYNIVRTGRYHLLFTSIPVMFVAHCAGAWGEAVGYLFGAPGAVIKERMDIELDRYAYVNSGDRQEALEGHFIRTEGR